MKNLFYIHSHITYYVSKGIINKLGFDEGSVLYVVSRDYANESLILSNSIDLTGIHDKLDNFNVLNFFRKHKHIAEVDALLEKNLPTSHFRLFLPHVFHPVMQILATHPQCDEIHIMEEGVNAYSEHFMHFHQKNKFKGFIKKVLNNISLVGKKRIFFIKHFDLRKFKKEASPVFYTITSKGFKNLPYRVERVRMLPEKDFEYDISGQDVLVLEGAVEQGNMKFENLLKGIQAVLNDVESTQLYIKFHPAQNKQNISEIERLVKNNNIEPLAIPNEIAFEQIILTNANLSIYGFTSSLLFYASEYNCKVRSYEDCINDDIAFKKFRSKNNFDLKSLLND